MLSFRQALDQTVKLLQLCTGEAPVPHEVIYAAVTKDGWTIPRVVTDLWTKNTALTTADALTLPCHLNKAYLLQPDKTVTKVPCRWDDVPAQALQAFGRLPQADLTEMLSSLGDSLPSLASSMFATASPEELTRRKELCHICPFWSQESYLGLGGCKQCGCSSLKLRFASSHCPVGTW